MKIKQIPAAGFASNCYLVWDENTSAAAVIDPSAAVEDILSELHEHSLKLQYILMTHGHFDHILSLDALRDATGAPAAIHEADADMLLDPLKNVSAFFLHKNHIYRPAERILSDGEILSLGETKLRVTAMPGHSPGSVVYAETTNLFVGDLLFDGSIGRTDLPGGDSLAMRDSLARLCSMGDFDLYPGHGAVTTLAVQRRLNPYL